MQYPHLTFDRNGKRLTLSGGQHTVAHLDFVLTAVVALVLCLSITEGEGHHGGESWQRVTHGAIGADEPQLEGATRVQRMGGAGDAEALSLEDPARGRLSGRVVPDLWPVKLHWREGRKERRKGERRDGVRFSLLR